MYYLVSKNQSNYGCIISESRKIGDILKYIKFTNIKNWKIEIVENDEFVGEIDDKLNLIVNGGIEND